MLTWTQDLKHVPLVIITNFNIWHETELRTIDRIPNKDKR